MNVLILPSEQFVPKRDPLAGTFQFDQAKILLENNIKVSVISIELKYSLPMIMRALLSRLAFKKLENATEKYSFTGLITLLLKKMFSPSSFITKEEMEGIEVYRVEGFYWLPPSEKTDYLFWIKAGMTALKKYIFENGAPDVIHAHNAIYAGLLAQKIQSNYQIPFVLSEHSSYYGRGLFDKSLLRKAKKSFESAFALLVVSDFLGNELQNVFNEKIQYTVLPNVVEPVFEQFPLNDAPFSGNFLFISIGSLIKLKRHSLLISAFHRAFSKNENVRLEIIGDGEERDTLIKLIIDLEESDRISLKGRFTKKEIFNKINEANVLCHSSEYETFGVVVLEALFRGVPVLSTKCGGVNDIVSSLDGISVAVNDEKQFTEALIGIKDRYADFKREDIRNKAIIKFGAKTFLEKLLTIYRFQEGAN